MKKLYFLFLLIPMLLSSQEQLAVYFDLGADVPNAASAEALSHWITTHNNDAEVLKIYGYADGVGADESNSPLSQRRADNVLAILQQNNIKIATDIEVKGMGEIGSEENQQQRNVTIWFNRLPPKKETLQIPVTELTTQIKAAVKGDKLVFRNLLFIGGTAIMTSESAPALDELSQILKDNLALKIEVQGHICCMKKDKDQLSLQRAKAVYYALIRRGIAKERLSAKGLDGRNPIYPIPEKTDKQQDANRRVEIEITAK